MELALGDAKWLGNEGKRTLLLWIRTMEDVFQLFSRSLTLPLCSLAIQACGSSFIAFLVSELNTQQTVQVEAPYI
jgi:hypothetical protein